MKTIFKSPVGFFSADTEFTILAAMPDELAKAGEPEKGNLLKRIFRQIAEHYEANKDNLGQ